MVQQTIAPYGSWTSTITTDLIVAGTINLGQIAVDGSDIYWLEGRPAEGGRNVLMHYSPDGPIRELTPAPFNVRTRVHEYGGGAYWLAEGVVYFVNFSDQRLYCLRPGQPPTPITPALPLRYADGVVDKARQRLICVREDHSRPGQEAINTLVALPLAGDETGGQILVSGNDFYATPRLSPNGQQLAWLTWHHPNMPWDGCELWLADLAPDGSVGQARLIAGGPNESIFQPEWSPAGVLHFVSDRTGWWNLYRWHNDQTEALCPRPAEFGLPQWVFAMTTYGFTPAGQLLCTYLENGQFQLATLSEQEGLLPIAVPYTFIANPRLGANFVVFAGGSPTEMAAIVRVDLSAQQMTILRPSTNLSLPANWLSVPEAIEFPTSNNKTAHAFFYPPRNPDYAAPAGELPPLLVISHGGPTSSANSTLSLNIQYWTSRGFGVLDVNYGGSSGYGREYRQRLNGQWGVVDVEDCINGANYLVERGRADGKRLLIRGGSAGGYTTLAALAFHQFFAAGASYYGIGDLEAMVADTHKFESRYLDTLLAPYPAGKALYHSRSPIHFVENLNCPVIFFQGLEDKVVPPNQAEMMFAALKAKGLAVAYLPFEGEQHGFRQAATIKRTLEAELYFYGKIFGFVPAGTIPPVSIQNLTV